MPLPEMRLPDELRALPEFVRLADGANHVDVKIYEGEASLNEFIAGFLNFYPGWIKQLYRVRWVFVRMLGMKQTGIPPSLTMRPDQVPMRRGEKASFFKVEAAEADHYWLVSAAEAHLTAYLGIVAHALEGNKRRFHVVTIVRYHRWTGAVYFNVIRPFHHLVVNNMARSALNYARN